MAAMRMVEYADASPEVRDVYDDIMTTRKVDGLRCFVSAFIRVQLGTH
jgi:hypothetical protein